MKVLLTGATGYIGSAVADALRAAGHQVIGLARSETAARRLETRNIRVRRGDLNDAESLTQAAREADAVIHTASTNDENAPRADKAAVQALLSALEGSGKPFIYFSGKIWLLTNLCCFFFVFSVFPLRPLCPLRFIPHPQGITPTCLDSVFHDAETPITPPNF